MEAVRARTRTVREVGRYMVIPKGEGEDEVGDWLLGL